MVDSPLPTSKILRRDDFTYYAGGFEMKVQWTDRRDLAKQVTPDHAETVRTLLAQSGFTVAVEPARA